MGASHDPLVPFAAVYAAGDPAAMLALDATLSALAAQTDREAERVRHRLGRHPDEEPEYRRLKARCHALAQHASKLRRRAWRIARTKGPG